MDTLKMGQNLDIERRAHAVWEDIQRQGEGTGVERFKDDS